MTKSDHVWRPKATGNGSGDRASQTLLSSRLALLNQMPRIPSSRSPAQKRQTARIQAPRTAHRRSLPITEDEQAEILRLKAKVKDLQRELRNERKRVKRVKAVCLRGVRHMEDKEKTRTRVPKEDGEVERLEKKVIEVEGHLEEQKKYTETFRKKVSRFPEQKQRAVEKTLRKSKSHIHESPMQIRTKSGRISTPARKIIRDLVLHHKVSTAQVGGVLSAVTNTSEQKKVSIRSSRRVVQEVGVGNQLRVAGEVQKAVGKRIILIGK